MNVHGLLAEFKDVDSLMSTASQIRDHGFVKWDAHTPFPVHGLDTAMGIRKTRLPFLVLICGITGLLFGLWMQWWMNTIDYPFRISGKPMFSLPANIPVVFEFTVLLSVFASFFGVLTINGLPMLFNPLFRHPKFKRATADRFFIYVERRDPRFDAALLRELFANGHTLGVDEIFYDPYSSENALPKGTYGLGLIAVLLTLVPFALIARAREQRSPKPRIHVFFDMDNQEKFKPQASNWFFADNRAMRLPPEGTVAVGSVHDHDPFYTGKQVASETYLPKFPEQFVPSETAMRRGQQRFNIHCSPCHGLAGYGDGLVSRHAEALMEGTWVAPSSLHDDRVRNLPGGELFHTITYGIRNMPGYGPEIEPADRWNIIFYVRALQLSQHASKDAVPSDLLPDLQ